ncbi:pol polyprotein [Penaeus vannamei]|uniref:RNA-directed DNA polymerase n=1 Tax=Penaeus vannamei TaxID=6689 RepID=A0A3R7PTL5_PENVA|nr:pol polyprotein [Penaeus vannamei]
MGKGHTVFSTLDLQSGFFQVQMDKDSRPLTAFSIPQGHFQFKSMPFGLRNSPITSRVMSIIMASLIGNTVFFYLDDLLVKKIDYLGHTVDSDGISPNSAKVKDILSFPTPREVKQLKSFLGLAGFYRPFIKGFAKIADPLSRLLTKDASFTWTDEHQQSFDTLKSLMTRSPTDDFDLSAFSRKLNAAETRYSVTDLEALAVSPSGRQARWIDTLLEFNPVIRYTPGASNKVADSLSRVPTLHLDVLDREDVKSRQRQDPTYGKLIGILESDPSATLPRRPHVPTSDLYLEDDLLFRRSSPHRQRGTRQRHSYKQLVIPEDLVPTILRLLHKAPTASHARADKAIKFARERYFFPRMASRITEHIRRYQVCPLHKGSTAAPAPALTYDVPDRPFQHVSVDILSGFSTSTSGCRYLLVFIDAFSRFCELAPIPDKSAPMSHEHFWSVLYADITPRRTPWAIPPTSSSTEKIGDYPTSPRPAYTDDYASRVIRKKQEIYSIARRHLQFERDRIIRQQHKLSRCKDITAGALVFHLASERSAPMPKLSLRFDGLYRVLQMRTLLHLLSLLHLSAASLPDNYLPRPRAILEDISTVSFISSYVEITINLDVLSYFYNTASTHLSLIDQYRHAITTDTSLTPPQVSSLLSFLSLSQADLTLFKDRLPRPHPRRQRRGLFNFMGDITSYLFGVATHDELDARFGDYERTLSSVAGKFKATFRALHAISDTVNSLNNVTRHLSIYTDTNTQLIAHKHFTLLLAHISLYQSRVRLFVDHLNTLTHDLILAVHGSVMSSLIPPSALESFIRRISAETRFIPLFLWLTPPFFTHYSSPSLHPMVHFFPLPLNGSFYGLSPDHDVILRSLDHTSLSFISSDALSSCSSVLCACFDVFSPEHSYFHSFCHRALLSDGDVQSSCLFNQLNSTSPFLLTLPDLHLLYFFSATHVSINCGSNHADREISATFLLPRSCQLSARLISLRSSHSFHFAYSPVTPTLPPMSLDLPVTNVSLPLATVRMLPSYRDDVPDLLTFDRSPHVTIGFPVLSTVISLAIAICGFLLYRHLTMRHLRIVSSASSARDDPSGH